MFNNCTAPSFCWVSTVSRRMRKPLASSTRDSYDSRCFVYNCTAPAFGGVTPLSRRMGEPVASSTSHPNDSRCLIQLYSTCFPWGDHIVARGAALWTSPLNPSPFESGFRVRCPLMNFGLQCPISKLAELISVAQTGEAQFHREK